MNLNDRIRELHTRLGLLGEQRDAIEEGLAVTRAELKAMRALLADVQARQVPPEAAKE